MNIRIAFLAGAVLTLATAVSAAVIGNDRDVQAAEAQAPAAQVTGEVGAAMLAALQVPAGPRSISAPRPL